MENGKEYISQKFSPESEFEFTEQSNGSWFSIKHRRTGTSVVFIWPYDNNWKKVEEIRFYNDQTHGWSGENGPFEYSEEERSRVDSYLKPVFETGWISNDIYLFGQHFKSIVHFDKVKKGWGFHYYSSDLGCASILFFPILSALAGLKRILGWTDEKFIKPIQDR